MNAALVALALMLMNMNININTNVDAFVPQSKRNNNNNKNVVFRDPTSRLFLSPESNSNLLKPKDRNKDDTSATRLLASTAIDTMSLPGMMDSISVANDNENENSRASEDVKVGVLLLNLGGPEKREDVEGELCRIMISSHDFYHNIVMLCDL